MGNGRTGQTTILSGKTSFSQPHIHTVALAWHLDFSTSPIFELVKTQTSKPDMISNTPSLFQTSCPTSTIRTDPSSLFDLLAVAHASLSSSTTRLIPALTKYRQLSRNYFFPLTSLSQFSRAYNFLASSQPPPIIIFLPGYPGMASLGQHTFYCPIRGCSCPRGWGM